MPKPWWQFCRDKWLLGLLRLKFLALSARVCQVINVPVQVSPEYRGSGSQFGFLGALMTGVEFYKYFTLERLWDDNSVTLEE